MLDIKEMFNANNGKIFTSNDFITDNLAIKLVSLKAQIRDQALKGEPNKTYIHYLHGLHLIEFSHELKLITDTDYFSLTKYWDTRYGIYYEQALKAAHQSMFSN